MGRAPIFKLNDFNLIPEGRKKVYVEGRLCLEEYADREGNPRTSAEVNASDIHFLGQLGDATSGAAERADENSPADEEAEVREKPKAASSRSGKKSGSKRASTKEDAGDEAVGIVEDGIPFDSRSGEITRLISHRLWSFPTRQECRINRAHIFLSIKMRVEPFLQEARGSRSVCEWLHRTPLLISMPAFIKIKK